MLVWNLVLDPTKNFIKHGLCRSRTKQCTILIQCPNAGSDLESISLTDAQMAPRIEQIKAP